MSLLKQLTKITCFAFDLDGVLTDGRVHISESGEQLRTMNIKDGYALQLAIKKGYRVLIISGGKSETVLKRLHGLHIKDVFLGVPNKMEVLTGYQQEHQLSSEEILYMGDDVPDKAVMQYCGIACCPYDAVDEIRSVSLYISDKKGGEGCVRDVIEKVLRIRSDWNTEDSLTTPSV